MNDNKKRQKWHPLTWAVIIIGVLAVLLAITLPSFVKSRNTAAQRACINNLKQINWGRIQSAGLIEQFEQEQDVLRPNEPK
jgi:type II secretory pathway pseudopilin PulG